MWIPILWIDIIKVLIENYFFVIGFEHQLTYYILAPFTYISWQTWMKLISATEWLWLLVSSALIRTTQDAESSINFLRHQTCFLWLERIQIGSELIAILNSRAVDTRQAIFPQSSKRCLVFFTSRVNCPVCWPELQMQWTDQ